MTTPESTAPNVQKDQELALTVVVPVMNEVDNIEPLISEIVAVLRGRETFEIIYVDDGSTDGTQHRRLRVPPKEAKRATQLELQ